MPHELSDDQFLQMALPQSSATNAAPPQPILPAAEDAFRSITGGGVTNRNAPPPLDERAIELAKLGRRTGVPFHQGLPTVADLQLRVRKSPEEQMEFLAKTYGAENVRLNELEEPVVNIKGEDYVVNPHKLTLNSLTGLLSYAPETLMSALAIRLGGKDAGLFKQALVGAVGAAVGATGKDVVLGESIGKAVGEEAAQIPVNTAGGVVLGGALKAGQTAVDVAKAVARGGIRNFAEGLPNPLAKTKLFAPANPELTREGVTAAQRLAAQTGIPANLSPAEATGIPLLAQLERRQESVAAGAGPAIKAQMDRDATTRAWQNWFIRPETLGTDEQVARRGLGVLNATVDPLEKDVALAKFALEAERKGNERLIQSLRAQGEAEQQAKIINDFNVADFGSKPVPLTETGDVIRNRVIALRDAEQEFWSKRYQSFFDNPETMDPVVGGQGLKAEIDQTLKELPGVTKQVDVETGLMDAGGNPIVRQETQKIPVSTPIRPRLEELSDKLKDGNVSINDLKQIRSDVREAIKTGEAIPGIKPNRLKQLYRQITSAIDDGLEKIGDPDLKKEWQELNSGYSQFAERFKDRTLAPLFKEADQPGVGNTDFTKTIIGSPDKYNALKSFLGDSSSELKTLQTTARHFVLENSLADGSSGAINGMELIRQLESLRGKNPKLFEDAFGKNGQQFIKASKVLSTFQHNLPAEEVEALLNPSNKATPNALSNLQQAERRLKDEYTNGALKDFIKGERSDLEPDKFIRFLPGYKLSDVQEVVKRLSQDPEVLEQVRRKVFQSLLQEARRSPSPADVLEMYKAQGKGADIVSGAAIRKALGDGDQFEKYRQLLGPDLFEALQNIGKRELLREEKYRVGGGTGFFAKGEGATAVLDALTPGRSKSGSTLKEMSTFMRDKVASWILASPKLNSILLAPHTLSDIPNVMAAVISSEPFVRAAVSELRNPGDVYKVLSQLKTAFGTAETGNRNPGEHAMSDEEFLRESTRAAERR